MSQRNSYPGTSSKVSCKLPAWQELLKVLPTDLTLCPEFFQLPETLPLESELCIETLHTRNPPITSHYSNT